MNLINEFRAAIQAAGLQLPPHIEPGKFHRFPGIGKRNGNTAGWCKFFDDQQGGVFGDFSADFEQSWHAQQDRPLTREDQEANERHREAARAAHPRAAGRGWRRQTRTCARCRLAASR